jgi:hypothetical protein
MCGAARSAGPAAARVPAERAVPPREVRSEPQRTIGIFYARLLPVVAAASLVILRRQLRRFAAIIAVCGYFTAVYALTYAEIRHSEPLSPLVDILVVAGAAHLTTAGASWIRRRGLVQGTDVVPGHEAPPYRAMEVVDVTGSGGPGRAGTWKSRATAVQAGTAARHASARPPENQLGAHLDQFRRLRGPPCRTHTLVGGSTASSSTRRCEAGQSTSVTAARRASRGSCRRRRSSRERRNPS